MRSRLWSPLAALAAIALCAWLAWQYAYRSFVQDTGADAVGALEYHVAGLESYLDKYRIVPAMLAQRAELVAHFGTDDARGAADLAAISAAMTGAVRIEFWRTDRTRLASSSENAAALPLEPVLASNFEAALQGRLGRALLSDPQAWAAPGEGQSPAPSYLFSAPVYGERSDSSRGPMHRVIGIVVVSAGLGPIQQTWALRRDPVLALSQERRIVLTNRPEWRSAELGDAMADSSRRLLGSDALALDGFPATALDSPPRLIRIEASDGERREFVHISRELPLMDANLHVVADTAEARARANNVALSTALLLTLLAVAGGIALERRAALVRRVERERGLAAELEARVEERTRELTAANARMAQEVREREAAERELRQAQSELIQAARLATLGQMSAAISHEFNQPLAAIRSYSDNAEQLIAAGREQDAVGNLRRIAGLVDRMGAMSAHLKLFSRQADADVAPMPLTQAIDGAMLLLDGLVRRRGVRLLIERPERGPYVNAGAIRLEQVVVNLISNALDAVEGRPDPTVWVAVREVDGMAELSVADNGPGIDEANRERITAPFFTTKSEGRGLGLGLAIVYKIVRDFGGRLLVGDRDQGGALMRVRLPIAEPGAAGPASARPVQR